MMDLVKKWRDWNRTTMTTAGCADDLEQRLASPELRELLLVALDRFRIGGDGWTIEQSWDERKRIVDAILTALRGEKRGE